jgi:sphingosine kinase
VFTGGLTTTTAGGGSGGVQPLIQHPNAHEHHAFLTLMWGMLADIDLDSEWLRCLGELRLYVYAVKAIVAKKTYRGRVSLKLSRSWSTYTTEGSFYEHRVNQLRSSDVGGSGGGGAGAASKAKAKTAARAEVERVDADGWLHLEDAFVSVNVFQVSHIATSTHVCPGKKLDEGLFLVVLVNSAIPRWSLIHMLLTADDGGLMSNRHVRVFRCSAYQLQPLFDRTNAKGVPEKVRGAFSLDGERIPYGTVQGEILPNAARIML